MESISAKLQAGNVASVNAIAVNGTAAFLLEVFPHPESFDRFCRDENRRRLHLLYILC